MTREGFVVSIVHTPSKVLSTHGVGGAAQRDAMGPLPHKLLPPFLPLPATLGTRRAGCCLATLNITLNTVRLPDAVCPLRQSPVNVFIPHERS